MVAVSSGQTSTPSHVVRLPHVAFDMSHANALMVTGVHFVMIISMNHNYNSHNDVIIHVELLHQSP